MFGLLGWNDVPLYRGPLDGYGVYYGSDNARGLLGVITAAATLKVDRWDERILRGLLANLRIAGTLGFQPNRIDDPELVLHGWRAYHEAGTVSLQPHYQAHMWAGYLWATRATDHAPFLDRAKTAIRRTMEAYPQEWLWTNGIQQERAVMLLCLAWLVRLENTPEHRQWLHTVADDMLDTSNSEPDYRTAAAAASGIATPRGWPSRSQAGSVWIPSQAKAVTGASTL